MGETGPDISEATVGAGDIDGAGKKPVSELSVVSAESIQPRNGFLEILKGLIRRKPAERVDTGINAQPEIEKIRSETLGAIAQRRSVTKPGENTLEPFDSQAEEDALNKIRQLGGKLTNEEIHRLAVLVTIREKPKGVDLTEEMVAATEKKLREPEPQLLQEAA